MADPVVVNAATGSGGSNVGSFVATLGYSPSASRVQFFMRGAPTTAAAISSIVSTNMTWTKVKDNTTNRLLDVWKGVPTGGGAPGTSLTVTLGSSVVGNSQWVALEVANLPTSDAGEIAVQCYANSASATTAPTTSTATPPAGYNCFEIALYSGGAISATNAAWTPQTTASTSFAVATKVLHNASGTIAGSWTSASSSYGALLCTFRGDLWVPPTITGSVTATCTPTATLQKNKNPTLSGSITVLATPGATLAYNQNRAVAGAITLTSTPHATLQFNRNAAIVGGTSVQSTVAGAMAWNRHAALSGAVVTSVLPSATLQYNQHRVLSGAVVIQAGVSGSMQHLSGAGIVGAVACVVTPSALMQWNRHRAVIGAVTLVMSPSGVLQFNRHAVVGGTITTRVSPSAAMQYLAFNRVTAVASPTHVALHASITALQLSPSLTALDLARSIQSLALTIRTTTLTLH